MVYEMIAKEIVNIHKVKKNPKPNDLSGMEMFSNWTEEMFDKKIELARKTRNNRKAKSLEVIKAFCLFDLVEA